MVVLVNSMSMGRADVYSHEEYMIDRSFTGMGACYRKYPDGSIYVFNAQKAENSLRTRNGTTAGNRRSPVDMGLATVRLQRLDGYYREQYGSSVTLDTGYMTRRNPLFSSPINGWSPSTENPDLQNIAIGKIFDQLRGSNQIVVDLAEFGSTRAMFTAQGRWNNRIADILDLVVKDTKRSFRSRDRGQKALDYATSRWLEYRYGWQPLAQSVYDAAENLARNAQAREHVVIGTASSPYSWQSATNWSGVPGNRTITGSRRARAVVCFAHPGSGVYDWTSLNPSLIAWELLPLSFVIDWFVTVGDTLSYLENWLLFNQYFKWGYVTHSGYGSYQEKIAGNTVVSGSQISLSDGVQGYVAFKNRRVLGSVPSPGAPRFHVKLGAERMLDAASLFNVIVNKKVRVLRRFAGYTD